MMSGSFRFVGLLFSPLLHLIHHHSFYLPLSKQTEKLLSRRLCSGTAVTPWLGCLHYLDGYAFLLSSVCWSLVSLFQSGAIEHMWTKPRRRGLLYQRRRPPRRWGAVSMYMYLVHPAAPHEKRKIRFQPFGWKCAK